MNTFLTSFAAVAAAAGFAIASAPALAQNKGGGGTTTTPATGVITIDQAKAEAGGVTAGDAAGFPVTISQPGSYRLTGNLTLADANTTAIVITSPNVTLDLGGFAILGPASCVQTASPPTTCTGTGSGDGIVVNLAGTVTRGAVTVANGTVRGMGRHGITTAGTFNDGLRIERMFLVNNGGTGAYLGSGGVIAESQLSYNGNSGVVGNLLLLIHNLIRSNGVYGVNGAVTNAGVHNVIQGNAIDSNSQMRNLGNNLCGLTLCP